VHGRTPAPPVRLTLVGAEGTIELEGDTLRCIGARSAEKRYDLPACYLASYAATIAHFVEGLRDARPFETEPADNLRTLALVEAVYQQGGWDSRR